MPLARTLRRAALLVLSGATILAAQSWRTTATHLDGTARVLLVGTRPEDEDNALIAWLSRGRHIETAFLSLTRGEAGINMFGAERGAPLAVVRTAELLAERQRDGAHQYFSRAFDIGPVDADSVAERVWPRDSMLIDLVSVIRAFRPQVIVALTSDGDRDATRRYTARLVAAAFALAGDTARLSPRATSRLGPWTPARLFTRVDSVRSGARVLRIEVGEFDRVAQQTYAEMGAEIRRLQRTQPAAPAPLPGRAVTLLQLDSAHTDAGDGLFATADTALGRLDGSVPATARAHYDTLRTLLREVADAAASGSADTVAVRLARVASRAAAVQVEIECPEYARVPSCGGATGDLVQALIALRDRAAQAMLEASGVVIDGVAERERVATGDSVAVTVTIRNGGGLPVRLTRLAPYSESRVFSRITEAVGTLAPDSIVQYTAKLLMLAPSYHWWQINGLVDGTQLHRLRNSQRDPVVTQLIAGEDRLQTTGVEATLGIGGVEVPVSVRPLAARTMTAARGDVRHPMIGVPETSLLFERGAEYERAGLGVDRLFRVFVQSARAVPDTLEVTLTLPTGLRADSTVRRVAMPPFSARNLFFHLTGTLPAGPQVIAAAARSTAALPAQRIGAPQAAALRVFTLGTVINDYPHIPSQHFVRFASDRVESVDLRVPPRLRVGYIRGGDDLRTPLTQLRISAELVDIALVPVLDLSRFTALLIGAGALRSDATPMAVPALQRFLARGGTIVVLTAGGELARSGLWPHPIATELAAGQPADDSLDIRVGAPRPTMLSWPNVITGRDWSSWAGDRSCSRATLVDSRSQSVVSVLDASRRQAHPAIITAPVGKGMLIHSTLCLGPQLEAARAGAARVLVNLLSVGARPQ